MSARRRLGAANSEDDAVCSSRLESGAMATLRSIAALYEQGRPMRFATNVT
jgi:hypothetical protein